MSNRLRNDTPRMEDIAKELGLSKSTVSRALSGSGRISFETSRKVRECAEKLGFRPNLVAKALACQCTMNVAAVLPFESGVEQMTFFHQCLCGMVNEAAKSGYSVLVSMSDGENSSLEEIVKNRKVDAVVLTQLRHQDKNVRFLKENSFPFVVIGSCSDSDVVQLDSRMVEDCSRFTVKCAENLAGESSILFVAGKLEVEANNNRLSGFLSGMEMLSEKNFRYAVCSDVSDIKEGCELGEWQLIVCSDDIVCLEVLEILKKNGICIGRDVKIASFHDSFFLEKYEIPVSALRVDSFKLGQKSLELALDLFNGKNISCENYIDCSFQMRSST